MTRPKPERPTEKLRRLLAAGPRVSPLVAPLVVNPLSALFARDAGFGAGYVGGGALGFLNAGSEANLSLTTVAQCGLDIRAQCDLALIMDGTCGWGDPVHVRNTMRIAEAAGFAAIEIEDQVLPKRVHHHVGHEHLVDFELAVDKIAEAVAARSDPDFVVIARTNAARVTDMDEALARARAFRDAGADLLLVMPRMGDRLLADLDAIATLGAPLAFMVPTGGIGAIGRSLDELHAMGFTLVLDSATPLFAMTRALRLCYDALHRGEVDPTLRGAGPEEERRAGEAIGLGQLLAIERRTTERDCPPAAKLLDAEK